MSKLHSNKLHREILSWNEIYRKALIECSELNFAIPVHGVNVDDNLSLLTTAAGTPFGQVLSHYTVKHTNLSLVEFYKIIALYQKASEHQYHNNKYYNVCRMIIEEYGEYFQHGPMKMYIAPFLANVGAVDLLRFYQSLGLNFDIQEILPLLQTATKKLHDKLPTISLYTYIATKSYTYNLELSTWSPSQHYNIVHPIYETKRLELHNTILTIVTLSYCSESSYFNLPSELTQLIISTYCKILI